MFFLVVKRTKNSRHTGWASRSLLGSGYRIDNTALSHPVRCKLRLHYARLYAGGIVDLQSKLSACVCRSNLGNKRTRFTHSPHRMAHTLKHFCSYSSIGTDTRCCSNGAGFLFDITIVRGFSASIGNLLNDGTVKNRVKARFCSGVSEEMFKVR